MTAISQALLGRDIELGENRSAMPYDVARSALFAALPPNAKRVAYHKRTQIASWLDSRRGSRTINFTLYQRTGEQLTQGEASVWLALLQLAINGERLETSPMVRVCFSANGLLRQLGYPTIDTKARKNLRDAIGRLGDARIEIVAVQDETTVRYQGSLVSAAASAEGISRPTGNVVYIDMQLAKLFNGDDWAYINLKERVSLRDYPVAQWLHTYYSTHRFPEDIGVDKLQQLAGRTRTRKKEWLNLLTLGLNELGKATGWACKLTPQGKVTIKKTAPQSAAKKLDGEQSTAAAHRSSNAPVMSVSMLASKEQIDDVRAAFAHLLESERRLIENYIERSPVRYIERTLLYYKWHLSAPYSSVDIRWAMRKMLAMYPDRLKHRLNLAQKGLEEWLERKHRANAAPARATVPTADTAKLPIPSSGDDEEDI